MNETEIQTNLPTDNEMEASESPSVPLTNLADIEEESAIAAASSVTEDTPSQESIQQNTVTSEEKKHLAEEPISSDNNFVFPDDLVDSLKKEWIKISLEPTITLAQLQDLKKQLQECLGHRIQLCGEQVERIDTAALQLLMAFINSPDVTVGWVKPPSSELCSTARLLGLSSFMNLSVNESLSS
jgi:ABC-type transporter Mla MlaB component